MKIKTMIYVFGIVIALLFIPFMAMQFSNEVNWDSFDFGVAAILLLSASFSIAFILNKGTSKTKKLIFIAMVLAVLFLIWAELAVGVFGTPFAGS